MVPDDATAKEEKGATESEEREKPAVMVDDGGGGDTQQQQQQEEEAGRAKEAKEAAVPEKLQDDDQRTEIWYKRWFFKLFPKLRKGVCVCVCVRERERERIYNMTWKFSPSVEVRRLLRANDDIYNLQFKYVVSEISSFNYSHIL